MELDLDLENLVNAAGGSLFALVGLGILALGGRRSLLLATTTVAFGLTYVVENLVLPTDALEGWVIAASPALLVAALAALLVQLARPLPRGEQALLAALAAAHAGAVGFLVPGWHEAAALGVFEPATTGYVVGVDLIFVAMGELHLLTATLALRARRTGSGAQRRALLLLGLAFGLSATFATTHISLLNNLAYLPVAPRAVTGSLAQAMLGALTPLFLLVGGNAEEPRLFRRAALALFATSGAGVAFLAWQLTTLRLESLGTYGVVRTIGVVLLVLAIVRHDLLGVPIPRVAVRRGPLAAGALALLFIVAQLAQNVLSTQYGLLMGGVVAGAFLFAAHPIQRAIERIGEPAPAHRSDDRAARRREIYATAVRAALTDHVLTREEERALAHLAEELGIGAGEAHDIRSAAEAAARVEGSRSAPA